MNLDIPTSSTYCGCIPLRRGLIAWVYVKIVISITLVVFVWMAFGIDRKNNTQLWFLTIDLCLGFFNILLNFIFVVSAHVKNIKVLRTYHRFCKANLVLIIALVTLTFVYYGYEIAHCSRCSLSSQAIIVLAAMGCVAVMEILLQCYLILLLKSEIKKLRNNSQCQFVRVAPEESLLSPEDKERFRRIQEERRYHRVEQDDRN